MVENLLILIIGLLIITFLVLINLVVIIISNQNSIEASRKKLQDSIRSYLDLIPLLLLRTNKINKALLAQRAEWFNDWHHPEKHWAIWVNFDHKIDDLIKLYEAESAEQKNNPGFQEVKNELQEREYLVRTSTHDYNSKIIKYKHKLQKKLYSLAKKLDFKYGNRNYEILADF